MKRTWLYIMGFMLLGLVTFGAGPAGAAEANGPYYATPSWDQKLPASTRFIVLSNWNGEAVLDRETGLVWERSPDDTVTRNWYSAIVHCYDKNVGGRKGWRLPTVEELASLVDPTQSYPALPINHPFSNVQSSYYWSASTDANLTTDAWGVSFRNGDVGFGSKDNRFYVWCVRGGQGYDAY